MEGKRLSVDLSALFITREMLIRESDMALFNEQKRRASSGLCAFCGIDVTLFSSVEKEQHREVCRIRAWGKPSKRA